MLGGYGRGGWIRTNAWQDQNLLPYRLATPLYRITDVPAFTSELPFRACGATETDCSRER